MKIVVVCDGGDSSATIVVKQLAPHSKHDWKIVQWNPHGHTKDADLIYFHYGGILSMQNLKLLEILDGDVPVIAGLRGNMAFRRWVNTNGQYHGFIGKLSGISCSNHNLKRRTDKLSDIPSYVTHSGVDINKFKYDSPPPRNFRIMWAGWGGSGAKMFEHYLKLPFDKIHSASDYGTWRDYKHMPDFYPQGSVYVSTSVEEGSPVTPKEAAASGRPVVGIDVGDMYEWIPKEYLVPLGDHKTTWKGLIPIIERFRDDRELLLRECARFRDLVARWDYSLVVKEYDAMFEDVVDSS